MTGKQALISVCFYMYFNCLDLYCVSKDDRLLKHFRFIIDSFTDCKISKALFFQNFVFCSSFSNCLSCDRGST